MKSETAGKSGLSKAAKSGLAKPIQDAGKAGKSGLHKPDKSGLHKAVEPPSALAKGTASKFDPDPEARANTIKQKNQGQKAKPQEGAAKSVVNVKPGSGHDVVINILAMEGKFVEVAAGLAANKYDSSDKEQSTDLLAKMMVLKDTIISLARQDSVFKTHAQKRMEALKARASKGDPNAMKTIENESRTKDGEWIGNVKEIISTCNGSYNGLIRNDWNWAKTNRNVRKFRDADVVFRQYPLLPRAGDKVFLMMFPAAHIKTVKAAILSAFGVDENKVEEKMRGQKI